MPQPSLNPLRSLFVSLAAFISGRLRFPRQRVGQQIVLDGETWVIFREAVLLPRPGQPEKPGAVFRPRFHVRGMSVQQNIRFSLLPMGFFLGLPGFRSKLWMYQPQSGDSAGYYQWDTLADAQAYGSSFAMRFMTRRSVPGSVSIQILPADQ